MLLCVHLLPNCFCMFHAFSSFYIGFRTIGTLFQFLHYLSIGTTIQFHHKHHRNTDDSSNEPQNPVPMTTIQNKQQNLKTIKSQRNRRISKENWRLWERGLSTYWLGCLRISKENWRNNLRRQFHYNSPCCEDLKRELKELWYYGQDTHSHKYARGSQKRIEGSMPPSPNRWGFLGGVRISKENWRNISYTTLTGNGFSGRSQRRIEGLVGLWCAILTLQLLPPRSLVEDLKGELKVQLLPNPITNGAG